MDFNVFSKKKQLILYKCIFSYDKFVLHGAFHMFNNNKSTVHSNVHTLFYLKKKF